MEVTGGWYTWRGHRGSSNLFHTSHPMLLFICVFCNILYNKLVNISVSLSLWATLANESNPKSGNLDLQSVSTTTWGLQLASEVGGSLVGLSPQLVQSGVISRYAVWIIELNETTTSWCCYRRITCLVYGGKPYPKSKKYFMLREYERNFEIRENEKNRGFFPLYHQTIHFKLII